MSPLDQYPIPHSQVAGRTIDDEAVLVLSESGDVEVLNDVGARIWELADGTRTIGAIALAIEAEYSVNHERALGDVVDFIGQLVNEQVVILSDTPRA